MLSMIALLQDAAAATTGKGLGLIGAGSTTSPEGTSARPLP